MRPEGHALWQGGRTRRPSDRAGLGPVARGRVGALARARVRALALAIGLCASLGVARAPAAAEVPVASRPGQPPAPAGPGTPVSHVAPLPPPATTGDEAGVAGSGFPTADPQLRRAGIHCVPHLRNAYDYQHAFDIRGAIWAGGDGAIPVRLEGDDVLWLFGDTFIGPVLAGGVRGPGTFGVHNLFIRQRGTCFEQLLRGGPVFWDDALPHPTPDQYYWPVNGVYEAATRQVHITVFRNVEVSELWRQTHGFRFRIIGMEVLHYAIDGMVHLGSTPLPFPHSGLDHDIPYGVGLLPDADGRVYLYGCNTKLNAPPGRGCYVARADQALRPASWEYWTGDATATWSADPGAARAMVVPQVPLGQLEVTRQGTGYLATAQDDVLGTSMRSWYSERPTGPWRLVGAAGDQHASTLGRLWSDLYTYSSRIADLPGSGPVAIFSVNTWSDFNHRAAWVYGPRFVPTLSPGPGRGVVAHPVAGHYTLDGYGHVLAHDGAPDLGGPGFGSLEIARAIAVMPDGAGFVVLDGYGGLHRFGSALTMLPPGGPGYWPGWDIARSIAITPSGRGLVVLDAWGGVHAHGDAPELSGGPWWRGWDIARGIALTPDGQGAQLLDAYGGVWALGEAAPIRAPYFGADLARAIVGTPTGAGYAILDSWGAVHTVGDAPRPATSAWRPGDRWWSLALRPDGRYVGQRRADAADALW